MATSSPEPDGALIIHLVENSNDSEMTIVDRNATRKRQRKQDSRATKRSNTNDDEVVLQEDILSTNFATTVYIKGETCNITRALRSKAKAYLHQRA